MAFLLDNVWSTFLIILFFGGSIFVHELGHFIAARRRGVQVERFSIGMGPAIFSWRGRDGVEYRLSWLPLGGYVLLPQLADLGVIEGRSELREGAAAPSGDGAARSLPPVSYPSKMIVFAAGAFCNMLFALALATVLWLIGQPEHDEIATTRIGYVLQYLPDNPAQAEGAKAHEAPKVLSPAAQAGLQVNDVIRAIDGQPVKDWFEVRQLIVLSAGHSADGQSQIVFTIDRGGQRMDVPVHPRLSGEDRTRQVGIDAGFDLILHGVTPGSPAEQAGFQAQDKLISFDGRPMINYFSSADYLDSHSAKPVRALVLRGGREVALTIPPRPGAKPGADFGFQFSSGEHLVHVSPFTQVSDQVTLTFRTLASLLNPRSDVGLSGMTGPVGIVHIFRAAAENGLRDILMFTILLNVNLAVFNLLPIPILDGGQMLFATISRLRGRTLPGNLIMTTQSVFMVLLLLMVGYVTINDVRRWARDDQADRPQPAVAKP